MKLSSKAYIGLFFMICLLITTYINITSFNGSKINGKLENRLSSLGYTVEIAGKNFPNLALKKKSSVEEITYSLDKGTFLLMIISSNGCNICQWQELEEIKKYTPVFNKEIKINYIYYGNNKINALRFNKFLLKSDTIYMSQDIKLDELNLSNKFPFILYIRNGIIIDTHFPIPTDTIFSNLFYQRIIDKL